MINPRFPSAHLAPATSMSDILIILGLIVLNGAFAMSELALVSARRMRLETLSEAGSRGARAALELADNPSRFLSTIQIGITLISIFNGAYGEASLAARLTATLLDAGMAAPYAHGAALAIVVIGITLASILFGELVPKRIALQYPETMATWIALPLARLSWFMSPFVKALSTATEFVARLLGMGQKHAEAPTEEEISGMIRESTAAGVFEKTEYDIFSRALRLDDRHLKALMTPRVDLELLDLDCDLATNLERIACTPYSRFPVYRHDRSQILGMVQARDLFSQAIRARSLDAIDIAAAVRPILYVPESVSAMDVLESFKQNRAELALIVDEYGDIQGMVTLADVMGALVGEVPAITAIEEPDAVRREDGSWLLDGGISLDRFRDLLGADTRFPDEADGHYHTLAGFVLYQLGYIPRPTEYFIWDDFRFEVVDMDGNRIDRLLVARTGPAPRFPAAPGSTETG
jgi:putative hemolysin